MTNTGKRFQITPCPLQGLHRIERLALEDSRGWFERLYCFNTFSALGLKKTVQQMNRSFTVQKGSVRGMHFQRAPMIETKLVSCTRGEVFDVAVDLRPDSPTYLKWHGEVLSASNRRSLLIPDGFAHGFQTLSDDCEMLYLHTTAFAAELADGLNPLDPKLAIAWPLAVTEMSPGDQNRPMLTAEFKGLIV